MNLDDLLGSNDPSGVQLFGSFGCQNDGCLEEAEEAEYFADLKVLKWECSSGHKSKIEEFNM